MPGCLWGRLLKWELRMITRIAPSCPFHEVAWEERFWLAKGWSCWHFDRLRKCLQSLRKGHMPLFPRPAHSHMFGACQHHMKKSCFFHFQLSCIFQLLHHFRLIFPFTLSFLRTPTHVPLHAWCRFPLWEYYILQIILVGNPCLAVCNASSFGAIFAWSCLLHLQAFLLLGWSWSSLILVDLTMLKIMLL